MCKTQDKTRLVLNTGHPTFIHFVSLKGAINFFQVLSLSPPRLVCANKYTYYIIDTDEIPGFLLYLKSDIFTTSSEGTIFIFQM